MFERNLLNGYGSKALLLHLSRYRRVKVSTQWIDLEIPKQTRKLIETLGLHII